MADNYGVPGSVSDAERDIGPMGDVADPDIIPESPEEAEALGPDEDWQFWQRQIEAGMAAEKRWRHEATEAEDAYFGPDKDPDAEGERGKNKVDDLTGLIHANIDVLKPLMFSETPVPVVRRRFRGDGRASETDLMAAEIGQRAAEYLLDTEPFQEMVEAARDDWLIAGRGFARVVYKADFDEVETVAEDGTVIVEEIKTSERVCPRHVDWRRFLTAPGHTWDTMPWIAFEVDMTRVKIEQRFGKDVAAEFSFPKGGLIDGGNASQEDTGGFQSDTDTGPRLPNPFDTAPVWEIWNKETGRVIWWSECYKAGILDKTEDPLMLECFYPGPKPLLATTKGRSLTPRPDVKYYMRRAKEVELATQKMREILDTISVSGVYPGGMKDQIEKLLDGKSKLIGVESWIALMEKGGVRGIIDWLPLEPMITALQALQALREQAKAAMFETSGVSDIMRAQGDPRETASAQNLKGRYAGMRLSERQRKTAEFARDLLRIMFEVAVEHFDLEFWADMTGLDLPMTRAEREQIAMHAQMNEQAYAQAMQGYQAIKAMAAQGGLPDPGPPPPEPPKIEVPETSFEEVLDRLRSDYGRKITLTIETDSTILADEEEDKSARVEFLSAFANLAQTLMPIAMQGQFDLKVIKELLMFGVRAFPKARTLEMMINDIPDDVDVTPPEDPSVQVAKIKAEVDKMIAEMDMADKERDRQHESRMKGADFLKDAAQIAGQAPQAQQQGAMQ